MQRTLPALRTFALPTLRQAVPWLILGVAFLTMTAAKIVVPTHIGTDSLTYWTAWDDPLYSAPWHAKSSYMYAPAFAQAIWPLTLLPWAAFVALWTALNMAALVLLAGPWLAALLLVLATPVYGQIGSGNIDILVGLAIALSLRYPAAWAFVLLTKITPGVGLVWYAVRREWRRLGIALAATAGIALLSLLIAPELWPAWFAHLADSVGREPEFTYIQMVVGPLPIRIAAAIVLVAWGAWTNRPWTLVVGGLIASPLPTVGRTSMLLGVLPLLGWGPLRRVYEDRLVEGLKAVDVQVVHRA